MAAILPGISATIQRRVELADECTTAQAMAALRDLAAEYSAAIERTARHDRDQ